MAVCRRGSALIRYQDSHAGATGERGLHAPAVLLVHGGIHERMDARRFWVEPGVAGGVAAAGYRTLLPDRRWSSGATVAPVTEHTWTLEGEDLAAVLRQARAGPTLVVAGSNGCSAALRLALDRPELVAGLVLAWPPRREDERLRDAFERSAEFVASAGAGAYLESLRIHGVPGWGERRPGLAFGVALTHDRSARASFAPLDADRAATLLRASGRSLLAGEAVRGVTDRELRSLRGSGLGVAVIAPSSDGRVHNRAVAERLAELTGARSAGPGFPETPRPEFAAAREPFLATLLPLLERQRDPEGRQGGPARGGERRRDPVRRQAGEARGGGSAGRTTGAPGGSGGPARGAVGGSPPAAARAGEPGQDEGPEQ